MQSVLFGRIVVIIFLRILDKFYMSKSVKTLTMFVNCKIPILLKPLNVYFKVSIYKEKILRCLLANFAQNSGKFT